MNPRVPMELEPQSSAVDHALPAPSRGRCVWLLLRYYTDFKGSDLLEEGKLLKIFACFLVTRCPERVHLSHLLGRKPREQKFCSRKGMVRAL